MSKMSRSVLWLVVLLLFPTLVFAQQGKLVPARHQLKTVLDYKKDLNLSQNQAERIKSYLFDLEKELRDLRLKLVSDNSEIMQLLQQGGEKQGSLKLKDVEAKIKEAYQVRANMAIAEIRTADKINKTLTRKQFEKWKEIVKGRRKK